MDVGAELSGRSSISDLTGLATSWRSFRCDETTGPEVVIHAMAMRSIYESFLHTMGEAHG